ncbi:MAG: hypothetical protein C0402_16460 [Thermodesulfovibrio sp.]|nr:hypothetical protein [Thermodesulfovibrio sp.]
MGTVFVFLSVPHFIVGAGILGVSKATTYSALSADNAKHFIYFVAAVAVMILPYAWYRAFHAFFALMKDDYGTEPETVVCLNCHEPFQFDLIKVFKCPKCGSTLEDLEGFYERHPALRTSEQIIEDSVQRHRADRE